MRGRGGQASHDFCDDKTGDDFGAFVGAGRGTDGAGQGADVALVCRRAVKTGEFGAFGGGADQADIRCITPVECF